MGARNATLIDSGTIGYEVDYVTIGYEVDYV